MPFSQTELELALTYHVVQLIIDADQEITESEKVFVQAYFDAERMAEFGFLDEEGEPTPRLTEARDEALGRLPRLLSTVRKLELVTTFLGAAVVDDDLARAESKIVVAAAQLLGLSTDQLDAHLDSLDRTVASIELPEPELEVEPDLAAGPTLVAEDTIEID